MKILLMTPINIYKRWPKSSWPFAAYITKIPNVTLPQLAASIPNHECEILDGFFTKISINEFKKKARQFDAIGISIYCSTIALNTELNIRLIKKVSPKTKIILGGHHATSFHKEWVSKGVDFVIRREGEVTFPALINAIEKGAEDFSHIEGITYSNDGEIRVNPDRPFIEHLDDLPMPRWELLDFSQYNFFYKRKGFVGTIETSRGCVHRCTFCLASSIWKHIQRYKSPERVIKEFKILKEMGVRRAFIADDNLGQDYERDKKIFQRIIDENIDISWASFFRIDNALNHPDLVRLAARAGCKMVFVGLESTKESVLTNVFHKGYPKGISADSYSKACQLFRNNNIFVCACFVGGYSGMKLPEAVQLISSIHKKRDELSDFSLIIPIKPFPETVFYEEARKKDFLAKSTFYHERDIPNIKGHRKILNFILKKHFSFILHPKQLCKIFSRKKIIRDFFRSYYYSYFFLDMLQFSYKGMSVFLKRILNRNLPEDKLQKMLINEYLEKGFIDKL